jgi:predicted Holliday junction resolvase-like endonuclease
MAAEPTLGNYIALGALLLTILGMIINLYRKMEKQDGIGKNNKEDIDSLKESRTKIYEKIEEKADKYELKEIKKASDRLDEKLDNKIDQLRKDNSISTGKIYEQLSLFRKDFSAFQLVVIEAINAKR